MGVIKRFIILMILFSVISCNLKPKGWWKEGVVAVMADSTDWIPLRGVLKSTFERVVRTPQLEKTFSLVYVSKNDFVRYTEFRYIVLMATLESEGRIGKIIRKVVSDPEIRKNVEEGKHFVFTQRNQWARNQLMVILVAKNLTVLREKIEVNADFLYDIFDTDFNDYLKKEMFKRGEKKELQKKLMSIYGWTMLLQRDYFLVQEFPAEGFVWFRRMYPERWIFVRWIEGGDTTLLNSHWVVGERNRIGATYYGGDRIANQYFFSRRSSFMGRMAQITSGLWENDSKIAGGPFVNYVFYDPLSRRIYMIDLAVFAPGKDKLPFLQRMEIIASTFRTVFDKKEG